MRRACLTTTAVLGGAFIASHASAQWVTYVNETATRLVAPAHLVVGDNLEKDFAHADFNNNGWTDLAIGRKFPGSIQGGFENLLLMNEGGVLVDRTGEYGLDTDVPGDLGFRAPTNDRKLHAVDVNMDGWIDLVTATTMSDQVDWILGQPRVYINKGNDANGDWQGFRFESQRIPQLFSKFGNAANPRFCGIGTGDMNGNGFPDIFYTDYDTPETSGTVCIDLNGNGVFDPGECQQSPPQIASLDYDNRLLYNWGNDPAGPGPGYFWDTRGSGQGLTNTQLNAAFGNAAAVADMNGNGVLDIIRINTLTAGQNVAIFYNNPSNPGASFTGPVTIYTGAPYNMAIGDLNNNGRMDLIVVDDAKDRWMRNNGNNAQGQATFTTFTINDSLFEFGNKTRLADLDNDGLLDVMIADVDADLPPFCPTTGRRAHIYRNTGGPGSNTTFQEIGQIIPNNQLGATYDFAPIDLNNNGWLDLVIGRCAGVFVWRNVPPINLEFSFPNGLPSLVDAGEAIEIEIEIDILGGGTVVDGTAKVVYSIDNGPFNELPLVHNGGSSWTALLPAVDCGSSINYYFTANLSNGGVFTDPSTAPANTYSVLAIDEFEEILFEDFESGTGGFTVQNLGPITDGQWLRAQPVGTILSGNIAAPFDQATPGGAWAFLTGVGVPGGTAGASDLDGGPTVVTSPAIDLDGSDAIISYSRWFFCSNLSNPSTADELLVQVSNNDGATWTTVEVVAENAGVWVESSFRVGEFVAPTSTVRVRFHADDIFNNSVTEAGLDDFRVEKLACDTATPCPGDFNGDGVVDGADLGALLNAWGSNDPAFDLDGNGVVDGADLGSLLNAWGACP